MGDQPKENQPLPQPAIANGTAKKKREEKSRRRDPRAWENLSKNIVNMTDAEKVEYIKEKYNELYNEQRKTSQAYQNIERQCIALQKEKEHAENEQTKCIMAKATLENLCRELQKQNKQIKEENLTKIKEEEERRKEVASKFSEKLNDITSMMDENKEKSSKLRDENEKMTEKLSELYEQFKEREDNLAKMTNQMDLQKQLANATIAKMEYEMKAEKHMWEKEREILQNKLVKSVNNCQALQENIQALQDHIMIYKTQYADFADTMSKSDEVFKNFKSEMSKMSKQIVSVEKEANTWKKRWQGSASSLIQLSELHQQQENELKAAERKVEMLQKLCRQLQIDRASFLKLLKNNGIKATTQLCTEETDKAMMGPPQPKKQTKKEHELEQLRNNLKALQDQLSQAAQSNLARQEQEETPQNPPAEPANNESLVNSNSNMENGIFGLIQGIDEHSDTDTLVGSIDANDLIQDIEINDSITRGVVITEIVDEPVVADTPASQQNGQSANNEEEKTEKSCDSTT